MHPLLVVATLVLQACNKLVYRAFQLFSSAVETFEHGNETARFSLKSSRKSVISIPQSSNCYTYLFYTSTLSPPPTSPSPSAAAICKDRGISSWESLRSNSHGILSSWQNLKLDFAPRHFSYNTQPACIFQLEFTALYYYVLLWYLRAFHFSRNADFWKSSACAVAHYCY